MYSPQPIPVFALALAGITFVALLLLGLDFILAVAVLAVWIGSIMLAAIRPPEAPQVEVEQDISLDSMRKLIENSTTPMLVTDRGTIAYANNSAQRLLGWHMVGQDARVVFRHPEAIALLGEKRNGRAIIRGLVRRQDIWEINRRAVDESLAVIELSNQTSEADISRAHTDFVANASHELRTPLAAILGYVETLREHPESLDTATSQKFLGTIEREGKRLQSLISDLMSLSRVEAEKHDLPEDTHDLESLVKQATEDAAGADRMERIALSVESGLTVRGDKQQLEQLIRNLVDNSLKYSAPESVVQVTLDQASDNQARLAVVDQGDGIAPEQLPHLTRRFYRTDPGRSRASGGTGLGLAIVKHIVERHRGRLDIQSELGKGTRVVVRIPLLIGLSPVGNSPDNEGDDTSQPRLS